MSLADPGTPQNSAPSQGCSTCGGHLALLSRSGNQNNYRCGSCGQNQSVHAPGGKAAPEVGDPLGVASGQPFNP